MHASGRLLWQHRARGHAWRASCLKPWFPAVLTNAFRGGGDKGRGVTVCGVRIESGMWRDGQSLDRICENQQIITATAVCTLHFYEFKISPLQLWLYYSRVLTFSNFNLPSSVACILAKFESLFYIEWNRAYSKLLTEAFRERLFFLPAKCSLYHRYNDVNICNVPA